MTATVQAEIVFYTDYKDELAFEFDTQEINFIMG